MVDAAYRIGTAGWSIASQFKPMFDMEGTHLQRYAGRFNAVEINSSFYRPHRRATYERWAASVAGDFRFSVKLPKTITHEARLIGVENLVARFAGEVSGLDAKLGIVLIQLPPSLRFDREAAAVFFALCQAHIDAPLACEPRHDSWFTPDADAFLATCQIARVAADPAPVTGAAEPGGWRGLTYLRLHGSPDIYRSSYADRLPAIAGALRIQPAGSWCIFDNTAAMAAIADADALVDLLA